jgi:hypothetical protein
MKELKVCDFLPTHTVGLERSSQQAADRHLLIQELPRAPVAEHTMKGDSSGVAAGGDD